jgi:hypothetical protein
LSRNYLTLQPPLDFSGVPGISVKCEKASRKFVEAVKNFELWGLKSK